MQNNAEKTVDLIKRNKMPLWREHVFAGSSAQTESRLLLGSTDNNHLKFDPTEIFCSVLSS